MIIPKPPQKLTSFMKRLKELTDVRDNRGKRHDLDIVIGGVILAIMAGKSKLSSIQRYIKNRLEWIGEISGRKVLKAVSRSQLPRILEEVNWEELNEMIGKYFKIRIKMEDNKWYAIDGKTLRGSKQAQERILLGVSHVEREIVLHQKMHGAKTSEIRVVREMLRKTGLEKGKITLDALHFNPSTTAQINQSGGSYIIQLKDNQPLLLAQLCQEATLATPLAFLEDTQKNRGRLETRLASLFDISHLSFDPRWHQSDLRTLIVLTRHTTILAKQKTSTQVSFYLSNVPINTLDTAVHIELVEAIRHHWHIESDNFIRDVSFDEDHVKTSASNQTHVLASLRTLAISLFRQAGFSNFQAALDDFSDDPVAFEDFLHQFNFL